MRKLYRRLRHFMTSEGVRPHHHAARMDKAGKTMEVIGITALALGILSLILFWYAAHVSDAIKDIFTSLLK